MSAKYLQQKAANANTGRPSATRRKMWIFAAEWRGWRRGARRGGGAGATTWNMQNKQKEMGTTGSREGIWKALEPLHNQEGRSERLLGHNNRVNQLEELCQEPQNQGGTQMCVEEEKSLLTKTSVAKGMENDFWKNRGIQDKAKAQSRQSSQMKQHGPTGTRTN